MRVYRIDAPWGGGPTFRDLKSLYDELDEVLHPGSSHQGQRVIIWVEEMSEEEYDALPDFDGY